MLKYNSFTTSSCKVHKAMWNDNMTVAADIWNKEL